MKLRYLGATPTTFPALRLSVEPDEEFDVPDDQAPGLLTRSDVEKVSPAKPAKKAAPAKGTTDATPDDH
jgi:hypothetical protein